MVLFLIIPFTKIKFLEYLTLSIIKDKQMIC